MPFVVIVSRQYISVQELSSDRDGVMIAGQGLDESSQGLPFKVLHVDVGPEESDQGTEVTRGVAGVNVQSLSSSEARDAIALQCAGGNAAL
jgi:hypothetical protein